jgi:ribosomal protein L29
MKNKNMLNKLKNMTQSELFIELTNLNKQMIKLKMHNSIVALKNPLHIRNVKRKIAKIKTYLNVQCKYKK